MKWTLLKWSDDLGPPSPSSVELRGYLIGRRLRIGYTDREAYRQVEGVASKANAFAILLDMGKNALVQYIEWDWISSIEELEPVIQVPKIITRKLGVVVEGTVRQHLADRHGWSLDSIPTDPIEALAAHAAHHVGSNLAHAHPTREAALTADEVAARTEELNAEYENALECDSCGYIRLPDETGKSFKTMKFGNGVLSHCSSCWDLEEFKYES